MSYNKNLQQPLNLKGLKLKNRVVLASLTRNRGIVPDKLFAEYYGQRASAGLILSEGVLIEPQGTEWPGAPGIWSKEQIKGWKIVTDKVHEKDSYIFAQLWHLGRAANALLNAGMAPPAPSAIKANGGKFRLLEGNPGYSIPKAIQDPKEYVQNFKQAAINAKEAGFDGIELHSANGYLAHQFLDSNSNQRTDNYGGSIENRSRFVLEVIDAFIEVFSADRVGIKLSPCGGYNDVGEKTEEEAYKLFSYLISELDKREVAYIQIMRHLPDFDPASRGLKLDVEKFFPLIKNAKIFINGGFSAEEGDKYIADGKADAVVYGRGFIPNPDLPERFFNNHELSQITNYPSLYLYKDEDRHVGYSDYPRFAN
ncbi:FMN-linked oxidoreductase [Neoconidiobolus thromboides FSU 785]|nr:FMN-linked oxidoreductase [Neoconidiobolus thromboides FSU 785]